jgi:hypothetical protein
MAKASAVAEPEVVALGANEVRGTGPEPFTVDPAVIEDLTEVQAAEAERQAEAASLGYSTIPSDHITVPIVGWEDDMTPEPPEPATGATAGIPGTWTPPGSQPPATVADLVAGIPNDVVADPTTPWTAGQFVQTLTPDAAGRATWTGTDWVGGVAPLINPARLTVSEVQAWVDDHDEQADEVLALEQARGGQARSSLITWLEGFIAARDEDN